MIVNGGAYRPGWLTQLFEAVATQKVNITDAEVFEAEGQVCVRLEVDGDEELLALALARDGWVRE